LADTFPGKRKWGTVWMKEYADCVLFDPDGKGMALVCEKRAA
jgi:hypothetical protein